MIKKEITLNDGSKFLVGFKEVGSQKDAIECHVLKKMLFIDQSIFSKLYLKGISPDYQQMALWTVLDYKRDCEHKQEILKENWD